MDEYSGSGDPGVDAFVDANLTSFAAWDALVYLNHNADESLSAAEFATRLGRQEHDMEPILRHFASRGIVRVIAESDSLRRYALSTDFQVRRVIARFVDLAKIREVRLEFVRRVLAAMSRS